MSKVDQAKAIYAANVDKSRKEVIQLIQEQLNATPVSASSYYATAKAAARIAAEAAPKSQIVQDVAKANNIPVVDIKTAAPVTVEPAAQVKTFAASRTRIAKNAPGTDALSKFHAAMSPEERAAWTADFYATHPDFPRVGNNN